MDVFFNVMMNRIQMPRIFYETSKVLERWLEKKAVGRDVKILITDDKNTASLAVTDGLDETIILIGNKAEIDMSSSPKVLVCLPCEFSQTLHDVLWDNSEPE